MAHVNANIEARSLGGTLLWQKTTGGNGFLSGLAVCDLDGNGDTEVAVALAGNLTVYDGGTGSTAWSASLGGSNHLHRLIAVDGNRDGQMELLATSYLGAAPAISMYRSDSALAWRHALASSSQSSLARMAVGDLKRLGEPVVVAAHGNSLRLLSFNNDLVDSLQLATGVAGDPLVGDLLGGDELEILLPIKRGDAEPGWAGPPQMDLIVLDAELNIIVDSTWVFPRPVWVNEVFGSAAAMGDADGDEHLDLAIVTSDQFLHILTIGDKPGETPWPMVSGNAMHTATYAQSLIGYYTEPLALFNEVDILGDVECESSVYVDATARVRVSDTDAANIGADSLLSEVWIRGRLNVRGSERQRVHIVGWDGARESASPIAWWGIFLASGSSGGRVEHCELRNAAFGLGGQESTVVRNCLIDNCGLRGITFAYADSLVVDSTTVRGSDYGVNALFGVTVLMTNSVVEDCALYGVAVYKAASL